MTRKGARVPAVVQERHLIYLDYLRTSAVINMQGAAGPLASTFNLSVADARDIVTYWMETFSKRHPSA